LKRNREEPHYPAKDNVGFLLAKLLQPCGENLRKLLGPKSANWEDNMPRAERHEHALTEKALQILTKWGKESGDGRRGKYWFFRVAARGAQ
jgi:hypothetical protein